jgi:hypothetical protein
MSTSKPAHPFVTPQRMFDIVHKLLHEIDPRNHDQFGVDSNCPWLVCYPDEFYGYHEVQITFQPTECLVRTYSEDENVEWVTHAKYRDPELLDIIFCTLNGYGLDVPEHVLPLIDKEQEELTRRNRHGARHAAIRRRR